MSSTLIDLNSIRDCENLYEQWEINNGLFHVRYKALMIWDHNKSFDILIPHILLFFLEFEYDEMLIRKLNNIIDDFTNSFIERTQHNCTDLKLSDYHVIWLANQINYIFINIKTQAESKKTYTNIDLNSLDTFQGLFNDYDDIPTDLICETLINWDPDRSSPMTMAQTLLLFIRLGPYYNKRLVRKLKKVSKFLKRNNNQKTFEQFKFHDCHMAWLAQHIYSVLTESGRACKI